MLPDDKASHRPIGLLAGLIPLVRPHWRPLTLAIAATLAASAANVLEPWPLKVIFDYVLNAGAWPAWLAGVPLIDDRLALLNAAAGAVIVIAMVGAVSSFCEKYLATTVGQRVMYDLRHTLYDHVHRLSLSFFEQRRTGDMVVRFTNDIDAVQDLVSSLLIGMLMDIVTLLGMLGVMLYLDWPFTLLALSILPPLFIVIHRLTRRIKRATREVKSQESALASVAQESISSARVVKAFGREEFEVERFDQESRESMNAALRARSLKARLTPIVDVIIAIGTCVVLLVGVRLVLTGELTAGSLIVFSVYLGRMYKPMKDLSKMTDTVFKASVSFERVRELLELESQVRDVPGATRAPLFRGQIQFAGVSFAYRGSHQVLHEVNLVVEPGEAVALVGPTGSGKSTLIGLIPRFYDVSAGEIRIDGTDIRAYTLKSLRSQISLVLQDSVLFHGSLWQNIAYGRPDATEDEIVRAAKLAHAHDFIMRMPQGYDTLVAERGETLSGGQRQRIAIARAVIRDTPILLLDEPSAALDVESEELVFEALGRLMRGRTSITVAHRLSTARRAARILVLDEGRIVESGNHDQLMSRDGLYARLYSLQSTSEVRGVPARG